MMAILRKAGLAPALDTDGDGSVSKEEADAYLADMDGDGSVSKEEREAYQASSGAYM